ncbi:hypothetical protein RlegWSM1455_13170 [Rhizobium laguerreae]|uniref:hypothetical protein n=1 Tax=Rhizobium laguerreae TaxID=1076926 RepID=UPI001E47549D|nr:hypothetical protein [Rhizobium laguerreae]UFW62518.1 hypothetical protein RlegWSM1455_13170 [Rhizobium laguerreae]
MLIFGSMFEVDQLSTDGGRHCSIFSAETHRLAASLSAMRFLAVIITGLAFAAPAAHAFALLNKIGMAKADYFIAQQAYTGWWVVGLLLPLALLANIGNAVALRADGTAMMLSVAAAALIALNLVIFMVFTQPANAATENWTVQPENWESLRAQWEYSHAVNAAVTLLAFCCATLASLR